MGYINHALLVQLAVVSGVLSSLPFPALAKVLTDDADRLTSTINPLISTSDEALEASSVAGTSGLPDLALVVPAVVASQLPSLLMKSTIDEEAAELR